MERNMTVIKPNPFLLSNPFSIRKKRVVAYARVSTSSKEQLHSFKAQKEYYENCNTAKYGNIKNRFITY